MFINYILVISLISYNLSVVEQVRDAVKGNQSKLFHPLVSSLLVLQVLTQDQGGLWVAPLSPIPDVCLVLRNVDLSLELILQQHELAFHSSIVDRRLYTLVIVKHRPKTGGRVSPYSDMLGLR